MILMDKPGFVFDYNSNDDPKSSYEENLQDYLITMRLTPVVCGLLKRSM